MATYEDIRQANDSIKTTDIKGKEYAEVNQRIKAFRMVYPEGFIITDILSNEGGVCVMRATVGYRAFDQDHILSTGTAYEKEGSTYINKTSYIENCETSAIGRALGAAGYGIDTSVASYEEVANAQLNQEAEKPITALQQKNILDICEKIKADIAEIGRKVGAESLKKMTQRQYGKALIILKELEEQNGRQ